MKTQHVSIGSNSHEDVAFRKQAATKVYIAIYILKYKYTL